MKARLIKVVNEDEDSIRFYMLPEGREKHVEEYGQGRIIDFKGALVV
jgi:CRISPR/Cas system-associated endoribonuclease Cas2